MFKTHEIQAVDKVKCLQRHVAYFKMPVVNVDVEGEAEASVGVHNT